MPWLTFTHCPIQVQAAAATPAIGNKEPTVPGMTLRVVRVTASVGCVPPTVLRRLCHMPCAVCGVRMCVACVRHVCGLMLLLKI